MFHVLLIILDRNLLVMRGHLHLYNPIVQGVQTAVSIDADVKEWECNIIKECRVINGGAAIINSLP